jgi:hypothetical protein
MVSENYFLQLDKYISKSNKPILLEIYYWLIFFLYLFQLTSCEWKV